jgi:hypothetical protein
LSVCVLSVLNQLLNVSGFVEYFLKLLEKKVKNTFPDLYDFACIRRKKKGGK